jgi:serine/threonine-protein kinase
MEDVEYALDTLAHEPGASSVLAELDQQTRTQSPASVERHTNAVSALTARLVPKKWQPALLGALALFLVLAVAPLGSISRWLRRTALPAERRVAVLPFQSSAGDPQGEMFASGLTEMVANLLSQSERFQTSLAVVPTSEVKRQNVKTVTDAYSTFNVNLTLTGTVLGTGAERQIGLTLVQTSPMKQVAARVVKAPAGDTRSLESNLLGAVLELLDLDMSLRAKDLVTASRASSPGAQDLYLRAQGELRDAVGLDAADRAIPLLQEATRLDAKYALAWCALTEAYLRRFVYTHNSADLALADQAADKAYAAGPRLAQAHYTQATVRRATGRYEEAIQALRKGLELDSTDYDSHRLLAGLLDQTGQVAEAEAEYKLAVRLKPSFWPTYVSLGTFYYSHGKMQQAEEALRTAVQLAPNNDRNRRNLGSLYLLLGKQKEGEAELRASLALKPSAPAYSNLGAQEFFHGNFGEAARLFEEATKLDPNDAISWGQLGEACLELPARRSEAAGHLKKAIQLAERQLEINPRQAQLVSSVAVYQAKLGQNGVALERVRTAMDLAPQDGRVMIKAARVFEIAKRRSDAVEMLRKAVALGLPLWEIEGNRELETVRKDPKFLSATMK